MEREARSSSIGTPEVQLDEACEDQPEVEEPAAINQSLKEKVRALQKSNWLLRKDKETLRHKLLTVSEQKRFCSGREKQARGEGLKSENFGIWTYGRKIILLIRR